MKSVINVLLWILGMSFNLALMAVIGYGVYTFAIQGYAFGRGLSYDIVASGPDREFTLVLEEDTPAAEVAALLEREGIISNQFLFRLELFLLGRVRTYLAGTYELNANMDNTQIHQILRTQPPPEVAHYVITIPEGWTVRDMAVYFESRDFFTAEEFIEVAETGEFNFAFLNDIPNRPNRLEGYLFPDTYFVSLNPTPREIITNMLRRFEQIFSDTYRDRAEEMGFSMDDIVIMASIIERETRLANERPLVSQVIHNRLNINMPLQMCSTVAFVLDVRRDRLTYADLEVDSPYNTYRVNGLPIGPISNPGQAAIHAALWPSEGGLLFFVLTDVESGEHFFSYDFATHSQAAARYNQRP